MSVTPLSKPSHHSSTSSSTAPMSESRKVFWFTISGWIGTALFYVVYEWIHTFATARPLTGFDTLDALEWSTVAWTSAYILSILWQHALHRYLVFGTSSPYLNSLIWTYVSYTMSIILSAILNHAMVSWIGIPHRISFVLTLIITGVLNYHTLKNAFETPATTKSVGGEKGKKESEE